MAKLLLAFILISVALSSRAAVITASSAAQSEVQSRIDSSSNGDVIYVPAGSANWTNTLTVGSKAISLIAAGIGQTIITPTRPSAATLISVSPTNGFFRLSGWSFRNTSETWNSSGGIFMAVIGNSQTCTNGAFVRIDNNEFIELHQDGVHMQNVLGVVDGNYFDYNDVTAANNQHHAAFNMHDKWDGGEWGHRSFSESVDYNGTNWLYFEANNFSYRAVHYAMFDHRYGARTQIRFNNFTNSWIEMHGPEEGQYRATRAVQIYGNNFYTNAVTMLGHGLTFIRSGTAIIVSNTAHNPYPQSRAGTIHANRGSFSNPELFDGADGTNTWDVNLAGGPFVTGTHTGANGATVLTDGTKSFTNNGLATYKVRNKTKSQSNKFATILSNTSTTITQITPIFNGAVQFDNGDEYEIWQVVLGVDSPGQGVSDVLTGNPPSPRGWPNQQFDTCFQWANTINGTSPTFLVGAWGFLYQHQTSNYCNNIVKSGWTPSTYPHPVRAANALSPASGAKATGEQIDFDMTGGSGTILTFQLLVNNSGGSINASSGLYTAGSTPGVSDTVRVWDSWGNYSDGTVSVTASDAAQSTRGAPVPAGIRRRL